VRGTNRSRELRQSQTDAERNYGGIFVIGGWADTSSAASIHSADIVDFVCIEQRVIVEVDGGQHINHAKYDVRRANYLNRIGFTVLRYWDDDALLRTEDVLENILMHMLESKCASPHRNPLPASGEREISSDPSE
jgi:very-short-patch-repair endonuclease